MRIIARLGHAARVTRHIQPAFEAEPALHIGGVEAEEALKRLVGEDQLAPRIELRHARGEQVEQRTLRLAEGAQGTCQILHILDIDGIARNALTAQRQVGDAQRAPLAIDGGSHDALDGLPCAAACSATSAGLRPSTRSTSSMPSTTTCWALCAATART
jgi:hypothetical protein